MAEIKTSVFELFKIGPGPSSSHTIGPMYAGFDFINALASLPNAQKAGADSITVRLFGSLSATGSGHGTDKAVIAGLLGNNPETCKPDFLDSLEINGTCPINVKLADADIPVKLIFDKLFHDYPHNNTVIISLNNGDRSLFQREYYSTGGGFIDWKGRAEPQRGKPKYLYENMAGLKEHLSENGLQLHELIIENETAITGKAKDDILAGLKNILRHMEDNIQRGLSSNGVLPGTIRLHRKAKALYEHAMELSGEQDRFFGVMNACAMAVTEENAAGHRIVTAPTCGSSGVIPAVIYVMKNYMEIAEEEIINGLLAASAIGFIARHNASLSGAEVGCQGEIGVASTMAAALLAYATGHGVNVAENAAETAMEHHLGLTCDPVGGYVQIPCIERNAMGAAKAYNSYLIAIAETPGDHMVGFDKAVQAMAETGRDMSGKYKETSTGGLAVSVPNC